MTNSLLRIGDTGTEVVALQEALLDMHFAIGSADGIFGPLTDEAVRGFQLVVGLDVDGIVGPLTRAELAAGTWGTLEPWFSGLGRLRLKQRSEGHIIEKDIKLKVAWQKLASDRFPTPGGNAQIDAAVSELVAKARTRASRIDDLATFDATNAIDLNAPSLASVTLKVLQGPFPTGWVAPLIVDLATDQLLAPGDLFMPATDFPAALSAFAVGDPDRVGATQENYDLLALRPDAVRVYWDPGHVLMEHAGIQYLDVPFTGLVGKLRPSIVARATPGFSVEDPAGPMLP